LSDEKKELVWNPFSSEVEYDKTEARNYLYGKYNIPTKKTLIGYVGRLVCYKKIDFFIACLYKLSDNVRGGIHLVVTGDGNDAYIRSLKQQVVEYGLQDSVTFTGFSGNPERIIAALDVLVAASTIDAFGRTLVEAMLQKTAVLASASAGHLEIVDNEVTGLLFEPSNCSDYIKKLSTLLDDENIRESYCRAGYLHAYKSYSSKVHMEKMISIYSRLMRC